MPAPPAIANAYINDLEPDCSRVKRGCVISRIARNHGQDEKYGDKGECYDVDLIKKDVEKYLKECSFTDDKKTDSGWKGHGEDCSSCDDSGEHKGKGWGKGKGRDKGHD